MRSSAAIRSTCAMNSATCCSRWCSMRAWPRSAAGSTSPPSPRAHPRQAACAAIRTSSPAPTLAAEDLARVWEEQKAQERAAARAAVRRGGAGRRAPGAAGADARGEARQARRARRASTGRRPRDVRAKVLEELREIDAALQRRRRRARHARGGRGARRPAVRASPTGPPPARGSGGGAARGQRQVRAALRAHGGSWRAARRWS